MIDQETKDRINGYRKLKKAAVILASNFVRKNPELTIVNTWDKSISPDDNEIIHDFCKSYVSFYKLDQWAYSPLNDIVKELESDFQYFIDTYNK